MTLKAESSGVDVEGCPQSFLLLLWFELIASLVAVDRSSGIRCSTVDGQVPA